MTTRFNTKNKKYKTVLRIEMNSEETDIIYKIIFLNKQRIQNPFE